MKQLRRLTSLAAMSMAFTASARADVKLFQNRCSPGSLRACASLMVTTQLNASGGTDVRISVRNLQGWSSDNTGGSLITRIGIVAPPIAGFSTGLTMTANGAATAGTPGSAWFLRRPGGLGSPIELTAGIASGTKNGGIAGCGAPQGGMPASWYRTCNGGWVDFTFSTTNAWSANNAEVAWLTTNMAASPNTGLECGTNDGGPNDGRNYCASADVTPEPISMLLLGSGLAGLGGFGFVRRRKVDPI